MSTQVIEIEEMRELICNTTEPLVIKDVLNWELLDWDLTKWTGILGNDRLSFRQGKNIYTTEPQFENTTNTVNMTFKEFLDHQEKQPQEWLYFDYKYLKDWLVNAPELKNQINWKDFGFPERDFEESTIWIGSKGAHTPCHIDTYGCNIVAQIYGRKRWILFPPGTNLQPTRIPYEESSIYSKINFFAPSSGDFKGISGCRMITLNPGDVLVVPHRWWHYVENLDLAISVNTWIELPIDDDERLGESIVQLLMSQFDSKCLQLVVNPSSSKDEQQPLNEESTEDLIEIVHTCLSRHELICKNKAPQKLHTEEILKKYKNIQIVEQLSEDNFKELLEMQMNRFDSKLSQSTDAERMERIKKVVDAITHSDVVNLIKEKLLET